MRERLLAVLGAVALVAVAFVVRGALTDDEGGGGGGGNGGGGRPVVACTADLMAVCDALAADGRIADDPPTLDLGGEAMADRSIDGWITWDPAPAIADFDDEGAWGSSRVLGSSPVTVAVRTGSEPALPAGCTLAALPWDCLLEAALDGRAVGIGSLTTAESLARAYPVALALVPDGGDFTQISGSDLNTLLDSPAAGQKRFGQQLRDLQVAPGALQLLVGPAVAFDGADRIGQAVPTDAATVSVVLAERGDDGDLLGSAFDDDPVAGALRDAGVTPGRGTLAGDQRAGELYALREKVG